MGKVKMVAGAAALVLVVNALVIRFFPGLYGMRKVTGGSNDNGDWFGTAP